ncbi:MAG: hypothetical protein ABSE73_21040 [Planctomycetota bacterium]
MRFRITSLVAAALAGCCAAGAEEKEKPKADEPARAVVVSTEQNPEWLAAIERLRLLPRPGEIKAVGVTAGIAAVYGLAPEATARCAATVKEYDAALLKLAAKWLEEAKALRAEQEAKLVQLLPDEKREPARKVLEFSHTHWVTPKDHEDPFVKEFSEKAAAAQEARAHIKAEEYEAAKAKLQAWVKERRAQLNQQDQELLKQIREMLTPEEAARLDQFDINRPAKK